VYNQLTLTHSRVIVSLLLVRHVNNPINIDPRHKYHMHIRNQLFWH